MILSSALDRTQIDIELGIKYVIYQKLASFMLKTDIVLTGLKCHLWHINVCFIEQNIIQYLNSWILKVLKYKGEIYKKIVLKELMKNAVICLVIMFSPGVTVTKSKKWLIFCIWVIAFWATIGKMSTLWNTGFLVFFVESTVFKIWP